MAYFNQYLRFEGAGEMNTAHQNCYGFKNRILTILFNIASQYHDFERGHRNKFPVAN